MACLMYILLYANLTDYIVERFGVEGWAVIQPILDAIFAALEYFIPCGDMWSQVWDILFT